MSKSLPQPELSGDRVSLRALEPTDLDWLLALENDPAIWAVSNTLQPYSRHALWRYLNAVDNDLRATGQLRLVVTRKSDGTPLGCVDLFDYNATHSRAELSIVILAEHRGTGYAAETVEIVKRYAATWLDLNQLYIYVMTENEAVIRLFAEHGFERAGVLRQWVKAGGEYHDVVVLQWFRHSLKNNEH